jgi:mersacidin/lichenicidin family type 2 lantibiotic
MKLDIVRSWKDEAYRQSLSDEQRNLLPANPVGELTEAEMEKVYGGGGGGGGFPIRSGGGGVPAGGSIGRPFHHHHGGSVGVTGSSVASSSSDSVHITSISGAICEVNTFSVGELETSVLAFLSKIVQVCQDIQ